MEMLPNDPNSSDQINSIDAPSARELVFDDEPLESVLYGENRKNPTPAGLFLRSNVYLSNIHAANGKRDIRAVIDNATDLVSADCSLSLGSCLELALIMLGVVPQIPNPILQFDLSPLKSLLEKIWQIALEYQDVELQKVMGESLFRFHEHYRSYEDAKGILNRLTEIYAKEGNRFKEGVLANNLAFEYFLEGRYPEALARFEAAAKIFEDIGDTGQHFNTLSNCWLCRFEIQYMMDFDSVIPELQHLAETLSDAKYWQARKPLILLARIAEQQGRIHEAIVLVQRAIKACSGSGTRYPETDAQYLRCLEQKAVHAK